MPIVSHGVILVATVNSIGAVFQLVYVILFIVYAEKAKKVKMTGFLLAVFGVFAIIVIVSLKVLDNHMRQMFVVCLSVVSLISMFASPLFIIKLVVRTRSIEFMPFYLSLSTFLMSISFFVYGVLKEDGFIFVPNGIGTLLGVAQLSLFAFYSRTCREDRREALIASYA
ncbi:hypothetical protein IFM89_015116 [Coptis chinensis]|uniref:Uncharacterized protein n=1 Tax=Coptis chinensis TaxID=261450 RepID=A0A835M6B8_9MAGN|nr:hypothetical protein IFM89_015116 [Coptis chinensis]